MSHWRYTFRNPKLGWMDARIGVLIVITFVWTTWWTILCTLICMGFLTWAAKKGTDASGALRMVRSFLIGPHRPAVLKNKIGRHVDFQPHPVSRDRSHQNKEF